MSASAEYPLEIEVNDHFIVLYELDGYPIDTQKARRLFLQPGQGSTDQKRDSRSDSWLKQFATKAVRISLNQVRQPNSVWRKSMPIKIICSAYGFHFRETYRKFDRENLPLL